MDPAEHMSPKRSAFDRIPKANGINNTSGGIGKNDASAKAIIPKI